MTASVMPEIQLSPDQERAAEHIRRWIAGEQHELIMAGYAGTGKSTVIGAVYEELREAGTLFVTPSAKAAYVLRCKGVPACTIHSAIYLFSGVREDFKGDEVPVFQERDGFSDSLPITPKRFAVDEASMVDDKTYCDLMDKGVPAFFIGDSGQLPPVGSDPEIMHRAHVSLTKIHRQSLDSGILRIAHDVREGGSPSAKHRCEDVEIIPLGHPRLLAQHAIKHGYDQIICAFNKTRSDINKAMRFALRKRGLLDVGDKLLCRHNNRKVGVFNGMQFIVDRIADEDGVSFTADLSVDLGDGKRGLPRHNVRMWKQPLVDFGYKTSERPEGCNIFEPGYAITGHASQGSQWRSTLVAYQPCKNWSMARWGYTALTRAEKRLGVAI